VILFVIGGITTEKIATNWIRKDILTAAGDSLRVPLVERFVQQVVAEEI
jgi:hypothetical protein